MLEFWFIPCAGITLFTCILTSPLSFPFQTFIQEIELNQTNRIWYIATVFTLILEFFILTKCNVNISEIEGSPQT